jgi:DNA-binding transcriptional MerR regulator
MQGINRWRNPGKAKEAKEAKGMVASSMLMAELSRSSGVPVATIKYYLREGLVPAGMATSATRAEYDEAHLHRLQLIRALVEIGEVPVAAIRKILAVVDDKSASVHVMLGTVQYQLGPHPVRSAADDPDWRAASQEVDDLVASMGWSVTPDAPARFLLAATLAALRRTKSAPPGPGLHAYAEAIAELAAVEVASVDLVPGTRGNPDNANNSGNPAAGGSRVALTESAVVGMVLYERVLIALRRLAQEDASARYFG